MSTSTNKPLLILGVETSCDETAAAVVADGRHVLSNAIYTQIAIHQPYGGVVPEIASRKHIEQTDRMIDAALSDAGVSPDEIDAVAVTCGPGLVGSLLCGVSAAKAYAYASKKPLIGVNHIEGHISANYITHPELEPPFVCLVVSGGHTHIVVVEDYCRYRLLGRTRDDAAGEAFDKVARLIGLGYPGGPKIEAAARESAAPIPFRPPFLNDDSFDFSFSGIKTAVINYYHNAQQRGESPSQSDVAAGFQSAVIEVLVTKLIRAARAEGMTRVAMAGGVSCNGALRALAEKRASQEGMTLFCPQPVLCTDNAAMIASAGYYRFVRGERADLSLNALPNLRLF
ncbi:MAG: tRNA (adenosine(37)-N6)-threonylcarbamoyltransferase complex transferase subunit TsaD [Eubacteriales bacterium]|nr:tRNA (adenosine(37)-N6)-threonylcarbamoyltransferase complex transferase subunit TsaD [Eubacteriales bacterium]